MDLILLLVICITIYLSYRYLEHESLSAQVDLLLNYKNDIDTSLNILHNEIQQLVKVTSQQQKQQQQQQQQQQQSHDVSEILNHLFNPSVNQVYSNFTIQEQQRPQEHSFTPTPIQDQSFIQDEYCTPIQEQHSFVLPIPKADIQKTDLGKIDLNDDKDLDNISDENTTNIEIQPIKFSELGVL